MSAEVPWTKAADARPASAQAGADAEPAPVWGYEWDPHDADCEIRSAYEAAFGPEAEAG